MSVYIIAEAGVNHNGSLKCAKELVAVAKEAGVDCVKFQTYKTENIVSKYAKKAKYQIENTKDDSSQFDMLKKAELSFDDFIELKSYCDEIGIHFLATPFDFDSIRFLSGLDMKFWKIPSGEITNYPYLKCIAQYNKPILLSTGMSSMSEIEAAINVLKNNGSKDITLLQCTTEYPAPFDDINLAAMNTMGQYFNLPVGYSDHTEGIVVPIVATALGATIIEKHFTLDKNMEGPDHKASLNPDELFKMVNAIRIAEKSIGKKDKAPTLSEINTRIAARKSIVAACSINKGEAFSEDNITVKRPGNGISPMEWDFVIGKLASKDYKKDELIEL